MRALSRCAIAGLALAALAGGAARASAAGSYDNCVNFIDAVPIQITAPGTWCLRRDVYTNAAAGGVVNIYANNVTVDCSGFRLSNIPAGVRTRSIGVWSWGF